MLKYRKSELKKKQFDVINLNIGGFGTCSFGFVHLNVDLWDIGVLFSRSQIKLLKFHAF